METFNCFHGESRLNGLVSLEYYIIKGGVLIGQIRSGKIWGKIGSDLIICGRNKAKRDLHKETNVEKDLLQILQDLQRPKKRD